MSAKLMKKLFASIALWLVYIPLAHAQDFGRGNLDAIAGQANLRNQTTLPQLIGNLVKILIGALGIVFLLLTVYAGYLYLTARGEEKNVEHAKDTLRRGVTGIVIILAAYAIAAFVINLLTNATTTSATTGG